MDERPDRPAVGAFGAFALIFAGCGIGAAIAIGGKIGLDALFGGPITPQPPADGPIRQGDLDVSARRRWRGSRLMARVLFVCLHNSGGSQMHEALFVWAAGHHEARSAGTPSGERMHPNVAEAIDELND